MLDLNISGGVGTFKKVVSYWSRVYGERPTEPMTHKSVSNGTGMMRGQWSGVSISSRQGDKSLWGSERCELSQPTLDFKHFGPHDMAAGECYSIFVKTISFLGLTVHGTAFHIESRTTLPCIPKPQ